MHNHLIVLSHFILYYVFPTIVILYNEYFRVSTPLDTLPYVKTLGLLVWMLTLMFSQSLNGY